MNNKYGRVLTILLLATVVVYGCSTSNIRDYSSIQPGAYLVLKRSLQVQADSARVFIQNGMPSSNGGFDRSRQHCRLEINNLSDSSQTIPALRYRITVITIDEELIANKEKPIQMALNTGIGIYTDFSTIGGYIGIGIGEIGMSEQERPETMDLVHFYLDNPQYSNILRLTCAGSLSSGDPLDAPDSYRPELAEINRILGYIGYIEPQNR